MSAAELIALGALIVSVLYHWLSQRATAENNRVMRVSFEAALNEWKRTADRRIDNLENEFRQSQIGVLASRVSHSEQFIDEIREWKHRVVDAYLPRAVDDHERRIARLEDK